MRAAIAQPQHARRMGQHLADRRHAVAGVVRGGNVDDAVGLDEDIIEQFGRPHAGRGSARGEGLVRPRLVVGQLAQFVEHRKVPPHGEGGRAAYGAEFREDAAAALGVQQRLPPRAGSEIGDFAVAGARLKRVAAEIEPHHHADRPPADLHADRFACRARLFDPVEHFAPPVGDMGKLQQRKRQRPAGFARHAAHDGKFAVDVVKIRDELEHAVAVPRQTAGNPGQLVGCGGIAGGDCAIAGLVVEAARGRKAQRPGPDRLIDDRPHGGDILHRGRLALQRPRAHDVDAQGRMGNLRRDIEIEGAALEHVEVFGKGLPVPWQASGHDRFGNVLHPFHQPDQAVPVALAAGGKADPAIAGDDRSHTVLRARLQPLGPGGMAIIMRVNVDKAGGHHPVARVDLLRAAPGEAADRGDAPRAHRDIAGKAAFAAAIDNRAIADDQIEFTGSHGSSPQAHRPSRIGLVQFGQACRTT